MRKGQHPWGLYVLAIGTAILGNGVMFIIIIIMAFVWEDQDREEEHQREMFTKKWTLKK